VLADTKELQHHADTQTFGWKSGLRTVPRMYLTPRRRPRQPALETHSTSTHHDQCTVNGHRTCTRAGAQTMVCDHFPPPAAKEVGNPANPPNGLSTVQSPCKTPCAGTPCQPSRFRNGSGSQIFVASRARHTRRLPPNCLKTEPPNYPAKLARNEANTTYAQRIHCRSSAQRNLFSARALPRMFPPLPRWPAPRQRNWSLTTNLCYNDESASQSRTPISKAAKHAPGQKPRWLWFPQRTSRTPMTLLPFPSAISSLTFPFP